MAAWIVGVQGCPAFRNLRDEGGDLICCVGLSCSIFGTFWGSGGGRHFTGALFYAILVPTHTERVLKIVAK